MLELAKNPNEQEKLRAAMDRHKQENNAGDDGGSVDIKQCPRVKHVARETLRLHTAAALGSARETSRDLVVTNSGTTSDEKVHWVIPKGSYCSVVLYALLRNHYIFGSDADEFVPSRWDNPTEDMLKAYIPFAIGKRNCQGMALAYLELHSVIARLTSLYEMKVVDEGTPHYLITLRPDRSKLLFKKL
jgi:cytochrome P450